MGNDLTAKGNLSETNRSGLRLMDASGHAPVSFTNIFNIRPFTEVLQRKPIFVHLII